VDATAPAAGVSGLSLVPRLGELFAGALQRLVAETRTAFAAAWSHEGERLAHTGDLPKAVPSGAVFEALYAAEGAVDLGGVSGWACGVALSASEPIAAICLGPGPVRPRTLAALNGFAGRLRAPAATAVSLERLLRAETEMMRVTRLATMGDLLAEAVHEIRNPLVAVKTFLQLLPENRDDPDFTENFRNGVIDEVRRMERLLDAILQQARPQTRSAGADEAARTSLGAVIESVGRLLEKRAQEKRLKLVIDVGADLPPAAIDEDPLRQIVLNLALNAFEVTPEHGRVALTATCGGGVLELLVDDEGPGIPDAERERLFEPFYSTRIDRPVGLGLAVCRRLAVAAGGSIHATETPRGGARLCVRLPLA
jgi:signal transduction histidine kinase